MLIWSSALLIQAALKGHISVVRFLVESGAKIDFPQYKGITPLIVASNEGQLNTVQYLIESGANINLCAYQEISALHAGKQIIKKKQNEKIWLTKFVIGWKATIEKHLEVVKYLLDNGAKPDKSDDEGTTPLHLAVVESALSILQLLLDYGADPNQTNKQGMSALYLAAINGDLPCVMVLIENGAAVDTCDTNGISPLYAASNQGVNSEILEYLLLNGAKVRIFDKKERVFQIGK